MILSSVATLFVLVPILSWLSGRNPITTYDTHDDPRNQRPELQLELRHVHAVLPSTAHVLFSDVSPQARKILSSAEDPSSSTKSSYTVLSRPGRTYRPSSFAAYSRARLRSIKFGENEPLAWDEDEILSPDVESLETLRELAKMTNNAYVDPEDPAWYDLNGNWNVVCRCSNLF